MTPTETTVPPVALSLGVGSYSAGAPNTSMMHSEPRWRDRYQAILFCTDFVAIVFAVLFAQFAWFGAENSSIPVSGSESVPMVSYWAVSLALIAAWLWSLSLIDSRSERVIGYGGTEYVRVVDASLRLFGTVAILAFLLKADIARGYLLLSLPLGLVLLTAGRAGWRFWLRARRLRGEYCARVLLVGSEQSVFHIAQELGRTPAAGYQVVGACVPSGRVADVIPGTSIPVMGSVSAVARAMEATAADTVAITSTDELSTDKVKQISWGLVPGKQHLVLAPSITDIAGPRVHTRPVAGLPLIHVETPRFSGGQRFVKRAFDIFASGAAIAVLSPLFALLWLCIRIDSPGPALFRQTRVGLGGREFTMFKFRSMVTDAERQLANLHASRDAGNSVMFKMKDDPRVTRMGRIMRRYSVDELPQFFNVIGGSMSLVGPRPPLPSEVAVYEDHVHRRFLAKPGITGLWQVSGRSTLSWEESVRLDLSYVENWTLIGDFGILLKTVRAVLAPGETAH